MLWWQANAKQTTQLECLFFCRLAVVLKGSILHKSITNVMLIIANNANDSLGCKFPGNGT